MSMKEENYKKLLEISNALISSGWNTERIDFSKHTISVTRFFAEVDIWADVWEERVSLCEKYHPQCYVYRDVSKEDMVNTILKLINEFRHQNFKLTFINMYGHDADGHDKIDHHYFPNEKSLLKFLVEEELGENIFSLTEFEHQYPNPACKLFGRRLSANETNDFIKNRYYLRKNAIVFELHHIMYKEDRNVSPVKVFDEIVEDRQYFACIEIMETE